MTAPKYFNNRYEATQAAEQFNQHHPVGMRVQVSRGEGSGVFTPLVIVGPATVVIPRVLVPLADKVGGPVEDAVFIPFERISPILGEPA